MTPNPIHVYPEGDSLPHAVNGGPCWCNPVIQMVFEVDAYGVKVAVDTIIVHTAADGRKTQERPFLHGAN